MTHKAQKWTKTPQRPVRVPGYRPEKPFRFTDWAAI